MHKESDADSVHVVQLARRQVAVVASLRVLADAERMPVHLVPETAPVHSRSFTLPQLELLDFHSFLEEREDFPATRASTDLDVRVEVEDMRLPLEPTELSNNILETTQD